MAIKDFHRSENTDREKRMESGEPNIPDSQKKYSDEAEGIGEVNVKNAHASGDGSMGRTDDRVNEDNDPGDPEID